MKKPDRTSSAWVRFWLGVGCLLFFMLISTLAITVIAGARLGALYGLISIIVAVLASMVDAVVLRRRQS